MLQARGQLALDANSRTRLMRTQAIDFDAEVNLFHFFLLRSVGKGAFGKVSLPAQGMARPDECTQVRVVQHKQTKTLYALKYINKQKCVKMKAVANIVQERRLLEEVRARPPDGRRLLTPV